MSFKETRLSGISSEGSTALGRNIFKCPSLKAGGAALIDAMPASIEKIPAATSDLRTDGISHKEIDGIDLIYRAQLAQTNFTAASTASSWDAEGIVTWIIIGTFSAALYVS